MSQFPPGIKGSSTRAVRASVLAALGLVMTVTLAHAGGPGAGGHGGGGHGGGGHAGSHSGHAALGGHATGGIHAGLGHSLAPHLGNSVGHTGGGLPGGNHFGALHEAGHLTSPDHSAGHIGGLTAEPGWHGAWHDGHPLEHRGSFAGSAWTHDPLHHGADHHGTFDHGPDHHHHHHHVQAFIGFGFPNRYYVPYFNGADCDPDSLYYDPAYCYRDDRLWSGYNDGRAGPWLPLSNGGVLTAPTVASSPADTTWGDGQEEPFSAPDAVSIPDGAVARVPLVPSLDPPEALEGDTTRALNRQP